jgi:anti-sigma factor RsiW
MNGTDEHLPPEDEADLAALADGSLYGPRRAAIEARIAADPELAGALERQRVAVAMIAGSSLPAPLALRMKVEELEAAQPVARAAWRWPRLFAASGLALAATLAALAVMLGGGGPAVGDVLAVGLRPATAPASLERSFEGVRFPEYEKWRATGSRTDTIDGRRVRTVFYERDGRTIAYAIVSGPALSDEGELRTVRDGEQVAVTWTRRGRTCVIVGSGGDPGVLARLAVW